MQSQNMGKWKKKKDFKFYFGIRVFFISFTHYLMVSISPECQTQTIYIKFTCLTPQQLTQNCWGCSWGICLFNMFPRHETHVFQKDFMQTVFSFPFPKLTKCQPDTDPKSKLRYISQTLKNKFLICAVIFLYRWEWLIGFEKSLVL